MRPDLLAGFNREEREAFNLCFRDNCRRKRKRKPSEWATEERRMPVGGPISGGAVIPYDHRYMPHCVEQMDAADDPSVRMIVIMAGIREGKTNSVGLNIIGRTVADDPGGIYCVHPTEDDANKFEADDLEPMIQLCPGLDELFVKKKHRESGRTKSFKKYRGGSIRIPSAGNITAFRGSTVKVLLISEADALIVESIYKAIGRTTGLADAIIVIESTPTYAATEDQNGKKIYNSVIHEHYEKGDMRKWFCACQSCGHLQWLKYGQLRWPKDRMDLATYHCEACDHDHSEGEWRRMVAEGKWFPTAGLSDEEIQDIAANFSKAKPKQPEVRSYWRNGFNSLLPKSKGYATKLHEFVAQGEAAKTSVDALKTWTNEIAAELWNPSGSTESPPAWKPLLDRREPYGLCVPRGGLFLTAMVDCQDNRLEVLWQAFGRREESWLLDHVVLNGSVRQPEVWRTLRHELAREFAHELKCKVRLGFGFIDGGFFAEDVYRFLQQLKSDPMPGVSGKVRASRGVGRVGTPLIDPNYGSIAKNLKGHWIGTWDAKDRIYERLRMIPVDGDSRDGIIHLNHQISEEFLQQATVETVSIVIDKGAEVRKYENKDGKRNEGLDLLVGCLAAERLYRRNWDALEAELKERAQGPVAPKKPRMRSPVGIF